MARPRKNKTEQPVVEQSAVKTVLVDPPSGWLYGFPKPMPADTADVIAWLVENGYPRKNIDLLGDHFYVKYSENEN